ncbi:MAG: hypothetical protein KDA87_24100 [Planctomycetales bacterium]|nr:hypothetical protein [Planctomycetales bacterium]
MADKPRCEFVAIDVETANADMSSICQIGIAHYRDGTLAEEWKSYLDPEDYFDLANVGVHGIDESTIEGAPRLPDVFHDLHRLMDNQIAVCHTHFDRVAIQQAFDKYDLEHPYCEWLDSARVARRTWEQFAYRGYGLANVCEYLGYHFQHHDALEDAKAAAHILIAAMAKNGINECECLDFVKRRIGGISDSRHTDIRREGNAEGPLYGELIVFTGSLRIARTTAADLAANLGCNVQSNVTKKTTLLVVGDQDITKLAGHSKSSKHRKVEEYIAKGLPIRILREADFRRMASLMPSIDDEVPRPRAQQSQHPRYASMDVSLGTMEIELRFQASRKRTVRRKAVPPREKGTATSRDIREDVLEAVFDFFDDAPEDYNCKKVAIEVFGEVFDEFFDAELQKRNVIESELNRCDDDTDLDLEEWLIDALDDIVAQLLLRKPELKKQN